MAATFALACLASQAFGSAMLPRGTAVADQNTAIVDLSVRRGAPQHLAAGFIYGIPDEPISAPAASQQIPAHFYKDMGFNYARVGGAQISTQGGWILGHTAYQARLNSSYSNYLTARQFNAKVILLPHDIWGTDHANDSTKWPGDNGDWSDYDDFLNTLFGDLERLNMIQGLVFDIWNEADGYFWKRSQQQYLDLWDRTYKRIRGDKTLNKMLISGPSSAGQPNLNNDWWVKWIQTAVGNNTIPDQYSWHEEPGNPAVDAVNFQKVLAKYSAPQRQVNINEYATFEQQVSVFAAWFISQYERLNWIGLRGNWLSGCQLRDFMASLVWKSDSNSCTSSGYYGNGEYQVYKYYNQNMTGVRTGTSSTTDGVMDVYATIDSQKVKILVGDTAVNTKTLCVINLSSVGLSTSGNLPIQTWGFIDKGHDGEVDAPTDRGIYSHAYSSDQVCFSIYQTKQDQNTAWAFEFAV